MNRDDDREIFSSVRPEMELLVRCVGLHAHERCSQRIEELLKADLDFDYLVQLAVQHRVIPLLERGLANGHARNLPAWFLQELRELRWYNTLHSLAMLEELLAVLRIFRSHHIRAISYKGPLLAECAYDDPALRQFFDLDLIVPLQDVPSAVALLESRGYYVKRELTSPIRTRSLKSDLHPHHEYALSNPTTGVTVELHCLSGPRAYAYPLNPQTVWKQVETVRIGEDTLDTLRAEAMALILCIHGTKHRWACLQWLCDVAALIHSHPDLDWDWILKTAFLSGNERILLHSLLLARQLLGVRLPPEINAHIHADPHVRRLSVQARNHLFQTGDVSSELVASALRYHFETLTSGKHKTAFVLHKILYSFNQSLTLLMPTEKERKLAALPEFLTFLYLPLRLARLAVKYSSMALLRRYPSNTVEGF
ncbi:MAG: nucleotidyltransferase family protein [Desulfosoma sp.]